MKNALSTFGLFLFTQLFLLFIAQNDNIVMGSEIAVETLILMLFMGLFFAGMEWARWVATVLLGLLAVLLASITFEGYGIGFLSVAILYAAVIITLFRGKQPKSAVEADEAVLDGAFIGSAREVERGAESSSPRVHISQREVAEGFYVGEELYKYPLLVRRYQSVFIDCILLFGVMVVTMVVMGESETRQTVMITLGVLFVLVYEPLLTSYSATVGQHIMGIRVRDVRNPKERIHIAQAYVRLVVKWILGWLSFITINFNREHRAIHDFAGSSVVIRVK